MPEEFWLTRVSLGTDKDCRMVLEMPAEGGGGCREVIDSAIAAFEATGSLHEGIERLDIRFRFVNRGEAHR